MYFADGARVRDYTINTAVQVTYLLADWSAVTCILLQHCHSFKRMERKGSHADLWEGNTKLAITETTFESTDWTELAPNRF